MQQAISDAAGNKKTKAKTVAKSNRPYVISVDVKPQVTLLRTWIFTAPFVASEYRRCKWK